MSKQLSISAAFSIFAMAAFALLAPHGHGLPDGQTGAGASALADTPYSLPQSADLGGLRALSN